MLIVELFWILNLFWFFNCKITLWIKLIDYELTVKQWILIFEPFWTVYFLISLKVSSVFKKLSTHFMTPAFFCTSWKHEKSKFIRVVEKKITLNVIITKVLHIYYFFHWKMILILIKFFSQLFSNLFVCSIVFMSFADLPTLIKR